MSEQFPTEPTPTNETAPIEPAASTALAVVEPKPVDFATRLNSLFPFVVLGLLVVVVGVIFFFASEGQSRNEGIKPGQFMTRLGNAFVEPGTRDLEAYRAAEEEAIRKAELVRSTSLSEAIHGDLTRMATTIRECNALSSQVKTDDRGRCIAANDQHVAQCVALLADEHITQREYEALQARHTSLSDALVAAESVATAPSEKVFNLLETLKQDVELAVKPLVAKHAELRNLIAFAATNEPSAQTLQAAIDEFNRKRMQERLQALAAKAEVLRQRQTQKQIQAQQKEADLKLAVQEQKAINRQNELVLEKKRLVDEAKREWDRKRREQQKAAALAEYQRNLPVIKNYLGAFIKPGHKLRGKQHTLKAGPASLSVLRSMGVMADNQDGMLALINATSQSKNDRSTHRFASDIRYLHPDKWHQADMSMLYKMHELLRKFGPIMVEQGLLSS